LTQTYEADQIGDLVNTMTDIFAEGHRTSALMMAGMFVMAAAFFDLIDGVVSQNPPLFISGVLFSCAAVLLFDLWKQNPR
jgi:drug/metabolite transporter (DMT)-like permease